MAPDDGRVVALTHGCGAHSETVVETQESSYAGMVVELEEIEMVENSTGDAPAELAGGLADDAEAPAVPAGDTGDAQAELAGGLADDEAPAAAEDAPQDAPQDTHGAPPSSPGRRRRASPRSSDPLPPEVRRMTAATVTPAEAAALLRTRDTLGLPLGPGQPPALLRALGERDGLGGPADLRARCSPS